MRKIDGKTEKLTMKEEKDTNIKRKSSSSLHTVDIHTFENAIYIDRQSAQTLFQHEPNIKKLFK